MIKNILINFCFPIMFMGIFTYFFFNNPSVYLYLLLIPYGLFRLWSALKGQKKYKELIYNEINSLNDSALIKAIPMNYMCKFVGESGIGFLYPSVFIFESVKKDFKLEIPYSDVLKLGGNKILSSMVIYQKNNRKSKFIMEESKWEEFMDCISEQLKECE